MGDNYVETLASQTYAGTPQSAYTTAKSVINAECIPDLPKNFWRPGRRARIEGHGAISNIVTTPGTMQFLLKLGTTAAPVTAFDSGNVQLNATAHTTLPFWFELMLRSDKDNFGDGTLAKLFGQLKLIGIMFTATAGQTDSPQGMQTILAPATAPVLGAGFNASIVTQPDFWAGFSINNAANLIRIDDYSFIDLGVS